MKVRTLLDYEVSSSSNIYGGRFSRTSEMGGFGIKGVMGLPGDDYPFPYLFGVEIENDEGEQIPSSAIELGLCLKSKEDVSVNGWEYITGILAGDEGMKELERCMSLMKNHSYNYKAGTHVHLSGFDIAPADLQALFIFANYISFDLAKLQDEDRVYDPDGYVMEDEDGFIENLNDNLNQHTAREGWVSDMCSPLTRIRSYYVKTDNIHKKGTYKSGTIEFRILDASSNFKMTRNYILFYSAICEYAVKNGWLYRDMNIHEQINENIMPPIARIIDESEYLTDSMKEELYKEFKMLL